jgi:hypothetical protein
LLSIAYLLLFSNYFPISQQGFYHEKSTGWCFYFKHIPGLDYPLKCYNDPVGTRELTQGEQDKVAPIWNEVIGKHTRPSVLPQPKTWDIVALQQQLRQEHPTCSIDKFPFVDIFGNNKCGGLYNDNRPVPCPEKPDKKIFRNLLTYIEFRFLDWLEAGEKGSTVSQDRIFGLTSGILKYLSVHTILRRTPIPGSYSFNSGLKITKSGWQLQKTWNPCARNPNLGKSSALR